MHLPPTQLSLMHSSFSCSFVLSNRMMYSTFLLYLPVYGYQTRNMTTRAVLVIVAPICLLVYGMVMNVQMKKMVCQSNHAL